MFAWRTEHESVFRVGLLRNRLVLVGIVVEVAVLVGLVLVPPLRHLFGLAPLTPPEWAPLLAFPAIVLGLEEGRKWIARHSRASLDGAATWAPRKLPDSVDGDHGIMRARRRAAASIPTRPWRPSERQGREACMRGAACAVRILVIAVVGLALLAPDARAAERRSGRVIDVDVRSSTVVIDEVGPWQTRNGVTQVMRHSILVTPATKIMSHIRVNVAGMFQDDFIEVPLELGDVARGDFVTVEGRRERGRLIASSIAVAELGSSVVLP